MLLFLFILIIFVIISSALIVYSDVVINIKKLNYYYSTERKNNCIEYEIKIDIYILKKIKIYTFDLSNEKARRKGKVGKIGKKYRGMLNEKRKTIATSNKIDAKVLKNIYDFSKRIKFKTFLLNIRLCTQDASITAYIIGFMYMIIPNIVIRSMENFKKSLYDLNINSSFENKNYIYAELNCIIDIKAVHIINMLISIRRNKSNE